MKKTLIFALAIVLCLSLVLCTACDKEPEPKEPEAHVCGHVCAECGKCTDANCTDPACAEKCPGHTPTPVGHTCNHVCPTCGKCTDATCTDPVCATKCQGHAKTLTGIETDVTATTVYYTTTKLADSIKYRRVYSDGTFGSWEEFVDEDFSNIQIASGKITATATIEIKGAQYTATIEIPVAEAIDINTLMSRENGTAAVKGIYVAHQSSSSRSVIVLYDNVNNKKINVSLLGLSEADLNDKWAVGDELYLPVEFGKQGETFFASFIGSLDLIGDAVLSQENDYTGWDGTTDFSTVSSIAITTMPSTLVYGHRDTIDTLDLVGGVVTVTYSDGVTSEIELTRALLPETDTEWKIGTVNYTVTFEGATATLPITYENRAMSVDDFLKETSGTYDVEGVVMGSASSRDAIELILKSSTTDAVVGVYNSGMAGSTTSPILSGVEIGDKVILSLQRARIEDNQKGGSTGKYYANYQKSNIITLEKGCSTAVDFTKTPYTTISTQDELRAFCLNHEEGWESRYYSYVKLTANMMAISYSGNYRIFFDPAINSYDTQKINYANSVNCSPIIDGPTSVQRLGSDWQATYFNNPTSTSYANPVTPKGEIFALYVGGNSYYETFIIMDPSWIVPTSVTGIELNDDELNSKTAEDATNGLKYRYVYESGSTGIWQNVDPTWCSAVTPDGDTFKFTVTVPVGDSTFTKDAVVALDKHVHAFNLSTVSEQTLASEATCQALATYYYSCECGEIDKEGATFTSGELADHRFPVVVHEGAWCNSNVCEFCHETFGEITPATITTITEFKAAASGTVAAHTEAVVLGIAGNNNGTANSYARYVLLSDGIGILVLDMDDAGTKPFITNTGFAPTYADGTAVKVGDKLLIKNISRGSNRYCSLNATTSSISRGTAVDVNADDWFTPALDGEKEAGVDNFGAYSVGNVYKFTGTQDNPLYIGGMVSTSVTGLGGNWLTFFGAGNGKATPDTLIGNDKTNMLYTVSDTLSRYAGASAAIFAFNMGNEWLVNNFGESFKVEDNVLSGALDCAVTPIGTYAFVGSCYVVQTYGYDKGTTYVNTIMLSAGNTLQPWVGEPV